MKGAKIKVFLADDHEIFRDGVKQLIMNEPDMEVIGTASTGEEALSLIPDLKPDVIIMDIRMPGINGLETSRNIIETTKNTKIIFFSLYDREDYVSTALELGAYGYILKDASNKVFLKGIRSVANGQYFFAGEVSDVVLKKYREIKEEKSTEKSTAFEPVHLSKREQEILYMIKIGRSNKEIAEAFSLSVRTIETHRLNILRKYKASSVEEVLKRTEFNTEE